MDRTSAGAQDEPMLRGVATALVMTGTVATMRVMQWLLASSPMTQEVE
jgi:hypothetical protein